MPKLLMVTLSVVAMLAIFFASVSAQCTRTTCPPGPVVAAFVYANCTGEPYGYSPIKEAYGWDFSEVGVCVNRSTPSAGLGSYKYDVTSEYAQVTDYKGSDTCDEQVTLRREKIYFNRCAPVATIEARRDLADSFESLIPTFNAFMFLNNVNVTDYAAPQEPYQFNPSLPSLQASLGTLPCASENNCTLPSGEPPQLYSSAYNDLICDDWISTEMLPNLTIGACYSHSDERTVDIICYNENMYSQRSFGGANGCRDDFVIRETMYQVKCGSSDESLTCGVIYSPPSSLPTPSNSNRISAPSFIMAIISVALLTFALY
jgi:hypothetical protein